MKNIVWVMLLAVICVQTLAKDLTGLDVMTMVDAESRKKMTRDAIVNMSITDSKGRERRRFFNYWTKHNDNKESSLIKFFRPKQVKGTALLTRSNVSDNAKVQWIYLPAVKSLKQLTPSDKNKSFMGSDFTFSDIAGRKLTQDEHQLVKETADYYYIESVPKELADSDYAKIRYVVSKPYRVVVKAIFYDSQGERLKTLTNDKISTINDVHVVMSSLMTNHQTDGQTLLEVDKMVVGGELSDDFFSIKGLKSL